MEAADFLSLTDTEEYTKLLDSYMRLCNSYNARMHHYELDTSRGFVQMARSRLPKINEEKTEINNLQPRIDAIRDIAVKNLAADPKHKPARLLLMYFELMDAAPAELQRLQQKINTLRSQVLKKSSSANAEKKSDAKPSPKAVEPEQMSLFD